MYTRIFQFSMSLVKFILYFNIFFLSFIYVYLYIFIIYIFNLDEASSSDMTETFRLYWKPK